MSDETPRPPLDLDAVRAPESTYTLRELAAEGWHLVRDGQAVHDGQVYDLEQLTRKVPGEPRRVPVEGTFRLRPVSQGIPATKEQPR